MHFYSVFTSFLRSTYLIKANNFSSSLGDATGLIKFCYLFSAASLPQTPPSPSHHALNIAFNPETESSSTPRAIKFNYAFPPLPWWEDQHTIGTPGSAVNWPIAIRGQINNTLNLAVLNTGYHASVTQITPISCRFFLSCSVSTVLQLQGFRIYRNSQEALVTAYHLKRRETSANKLLLQ